MFGHGKRPAVAGRFFFCAVTQRGKLLTTSDNCPITPLRVIFVKAYAIPEQWRKPGRRDHLRNYWITNCLQYFLSTPITRPCSWTDLAGTTIGFMAALEG